MPQFEVRTSAESDRVVVSLSGECDLMVRDEVTSALLTAVERSRLVCVDLGGLTFMDSSGIHALVRAHHAALANGGHLFVINAAGAVRSVLDLTGVGDLLRPRSTGDVEHV